MSHIQDLSEEGSAISLLISITHKMLVSVKPEDNILIF